MESKAKVPWLDGLRGIAALWVLLSHVQILSGMHWVPGLSRGDLAVDLFMVLSGFLMAHHYLLRREQDPWRSPKTWCVFWVRRFFRIAPLYYLLFLLALGIGPWLGSQRQAIAHVWPATATSLARYTDQSLANITFHASFVFGFSPHYAFRSPLPDWSIGLEVQFYMALPFLMLLFARFGAIASAAVLSVGAMLAVHAYPEYFNQFEMPTFLPMKIPIFCLGMLLAFGRLHFYELLANAPWLFDGVRIALSGRLAKFLGDTSYGVYLLHLLVLLPLAGYLSGSSNFVHLTAILRFGLIAAVLLPIVYGLAWVLHITVEQPGIALGKKVVTRLHQRSACNKTHAM